MVSESINPVFLLLPLPFSGTLDLEQLAVTDHCPMDVVTR